MLGRAATRGERVLLAIYVVRVRWRSSAMAAALGGPTVPADARLRARAALAAVVGAPGALPATLSAGADARHARRRELDRPRTVSSSTLEGSQGLLVGPVIGGVLAATAGSSEVAVAAAAGAVSLAARAARRARPARGRRLAGGRRTRPAAQPYARSRSACVRTLAAARRHPRLIGLLVFKLADDRARAARNVLAGRRGDRSRLGMGDAGVGRAETRRSAPARLLGRARGGGARRPVDRLGRVLRSRARAFGRAPSPRSAPRPAGRGGRSRASGWSASATRRLDVSGFTLLERTVDEHVLGTLVFGAPRDRYRPDHGGRLGARLGARGTAGDPLRTRRLGVRSCLSSPCCPSPDSGGSTPPWRSRSGSSSSCPGVPLFSLLPPTTQERLAARLERLDVTVGDDRRRAGRGRRPLLSSSPAARSTWCWTA